MRILRFLLFAFLIDFSFVTSGEKPLPWIEGFHGKELEIIDSFLPEDPYIIEAGSHYGEDTTIMAKKWPKAKLFGFEPNPNAFSHLMNATSEFSNISIFPFGLFSKTGFYVFNVNLGDEGSSSLLDDNHIPGVTHYNDSPISVFCMNLDEWAESNHITKIDYMWLDMEGAELYMLAGAPKILKTVSAISIEANFCEFRKGTSQFYDVLSFLEQNGFALYKIWGIPTWQATAVFIRTEKLKEPHLHTD